MKYLYAILAFCAVIGATFTAGYKHGYEAERQNVQGAIDEANAAARMTEQELNGKIADLSTQLVKVQDDAKKQIAKLNSDLVSNKLQFYVKVKPSTNCPSSTPAPAGANQTDVAQLDTSTATALVNITAQGDEGITRLNACVAFYNQIRSMINASPNSR